LLVIGRQIAEPKATDQFDWESVPQRMRPVVKMLLKAGGAAFVILGLLFVWSQWFHHPTSSRLVDYGFMPLLFAWEALFLAYGKTRTEENAG
jgi:ABC-type uncharacterized transport system YnjBCD permease subunit